jgi:fermentation-respiration switch protein FrsA (DUF1100 family)
MRSNVTFKSNGLKLASHLYLPDDYKKGEKRPAIVVSHPFGGVKEQTAGLYAKRLSEKGFITLAFDASYQGESEGEPRFLEDPFARAEDIKSAVSFLEARDDVDEQKIGALGICASGGYVPYAAQTDRRIKAIATVSAADMGDLFRKGLPSSTHPGTSPESLDHLIEESNKARIEEAKGQPPSRQHIVPNTPEEVPKDAPTLYREGTDYYRTPRAQHPNSKNWFLTKSIDQIVQYSSYDHVDMISPHPLLMIAGTNADTRFYSEMAIDKAKDPRELFLVEGATHIDLYDKDKYVAPAVEKMSSFFNQYLQPATKSLNP